MAAMARRVPWPVNGWLDRKSCAYRGVHRRLRRRIWTVPCSTASSARSMTRCWRVSASSPNMSSSASGSARSAGSERSASFGRLQNGGHAGSGRAGVVELYVVEGDELVLNEGQARQPVTRLLGADVVEQEDRPGPVGLEEDLPDKALRPQLGDPAPLGFQVRPDVLAGQMPYYQNFHGVPFPRDARCAASYPSGNC